MSWTLRKPDDNFVTFGNIVSLQFQQKKATLRPLIAQPPARGTSGPDTYPY